MWKAAFDCDPIDRRGLGVRSHRVSRPVGDANYTVVELEFDTTREAEDCCVALHQLWKSPSAAPALMGTPQARIVETVERTEY